MIEEKQPGKSYTATELFDALNEAVFDDFSTTSKIDRFAIRAHYLYAEAFVKNYIGTKVVENMGLPISGFMISQMKNNLNSVERLSKTHATAEGREHYRGLYVYMKHLMAKIEIENATKAAQKKTGAPKTLSLVPCLENCNSAWL